MIPTDNIQKFSRKNLLPDSSGGIPNTPESDHIFQQNTKLLLRAREQYDSLLSFRRERARCIQYTFGDQFGDIIQDSEGCGGITERKYMMSKGITPLEMNIIRKNVKALLGVFRNMENEPLAIARDRDEQKLGEMMSIALQYAYQNGFIKEKDSRGYEEFLLSSVVCFRTGYDYNAERQTSDVTVELMDINRMFWDENTSGMYFENINTIGVLHDMSLGEILSKFAHNKKEKEQIITIYEQGFNGVSTDTFQFDKDHTDTDVNFYRSESKDTLRVYEIWTKESEDMYLCHDIASGEQYTLDISQEGAILAENQSRIQQMIDAGGSAEDASLIEYEYKVSEIWRVRYLTPNGFVLLQMDTPYAHGGHPFTIGAYPLVDGQVHSFVEDIINIQRMVNRLLTRIEFTRMNAAKGFGIVNENVLKHSKMSLKEFARQFTSPAGMVSLPFEPGEEPFKQYNDTSNYSGDVSMLQQYLELSKEVTGVFGALRGEDAKSSTPSSLYAQQAQNANNNIADAQEWYNGLLLKRNTKVMQVIQQFYQGVKYINIAGKDYDEESRWYDSDKIRNTGFDLSMQQSSSSQLYRQNNEQILLQLLQGGLIDIKSYLECSSSVSADKLLEKIRQREEEQQQQAQQQQALAQAQQAQLVQDQQSQQQATQQVPPPPQEGMPSQGDLRSMIPQQAQ